MQNQVELFKELSIAVHPDNHPLKKHVVEKLMQQISANKHNYSVLISLKNEIVKELKLRLPFYTYGYY